MSLVIPQDSLTSTTVAMCSGHGIDGSPDRPLDSVMCGRLLIEGGTTQCDTVGIGPIGTILDVHMPRLVGNTDSTGAEGRTSIEMIDVWRYVIITELEGTTLVEITGQ